jgi:hypothetical protein
MRVYGFSIRRRMDSSLKGPHPSSPIPLPRHPEHRLDLPPVDIELPRLGVVFRQPHIVVRLLDKRLHHGAAVMEFDEDGAA